MDEKAMAAVSTAATVTNAMSGNPLGNANDPAGKAIKGFNGHFDGQGHTVSGIRIYKSAYYGDGYQGLFGQTGSSADIHNVTLANADITGGDYTGGIVGENYGTVSNCHVTATVAIHTVQPDVWDHGGIVGENLGTVRECFSAATLTNTGNGSSTTYGGIAGFNHGTMSNNLAIGAVVPEAAENNAYGAICGWNYDGTLENNYYAACTVAGVANAVGVGCGNISDGNDGYTVADIDGAVPALRDNADNSDALTLVAKIATAGFEDSPLDLGWGEGEYPMQLAGRTLYKDGSWNTLCLPFDLTLSGSILDGNNVQLMTLGDASFSNGTLTLNFVKAEEIKAGVPYIIKWSEGGNIVNPVFKNVTIDNASLDENAFTNSVISFKGIFSPFEITEANKKLLYMGDGNLLYYPSDAMTIGAFRAYFELQGDIECGEPESPEGINHFVLNFGGEETGIVDVDLKSISQEPGNSNLLQQYGTDGWFTLDGRRLNNKPAVKGIYVNKGKKMIIK